MTEIEYLESKIRENRKECERLRQKEANDECAAKLYAIYDSLKEKGFSDDEAWELFMEMIRVAWRNS